VTNKYVDFCSGLKMCNTRNWFPYAINCDWFVWCWSRLWLNYYCWMMSASLNHCKKMEERPGRFLQQLAAKLEPLIFVGCFCGNCRI